MIIEPYGVSTFEFDFQVYVASADTELCEIDRISFTKYYNHLSGSSVPPDSIEIDAAMHPLMFDDHPNILCKLFLHLFDLGSLMDEMEMKLRHMILEGDKLCHYYDIRQLVNGSHPYQQLRNNFQAFQQKYLQLHNQCSAWYVHKLTHYTRIQDFLDIGDNEDGEGLIAQLPSGIALMIISYLKVAQTDHLLQFYDYKRVQTEMSALLKVSQEQERRSLSKRNALGIGYMASVMALGIGVSFILKTLMPS